MKIKRRKSREVKIGNITIGGANPVAVQSMAKTFTSDLPATLREIEKLQNSGCQIVRVAVRDNKDAANLKKIKQGIAIPLVADIHFSKDLAFKAIESGIDKIRLNPGNIYKKNEIKEIAEAAKQAHIPIRVGINSGSLRRVKGKRLKVKGIADMMIREALDYIKILEKFRFCDIVVSLKGSNIFDTIEAYRKMAKICDYPLHLGVTAAGPSSAGIIKSAIVIGGLLSEGIGDTIRISLTDSAVREIEAAYNILEALGLTCARAEIISCPTCGRCEVDLIKIVKEIDKKINQSIVHSPQSIDKNYRLSTIDYRLPLKVAIMGCVVNGPGEAKDADIGVAFGKKEGLLFEKGKPIRKVSTDRCVSVLLEEISKFRKLGANVLVKSFYPNVKRDAARS